ncbi:copper amine oxidase N-terminal domain-containing protein [Paenibacillus wynnii]|uniref:copper amine oxidase N-terminal domain-containing protein n=1 Tax=Paenibacillus wynnii TaxID=268407 RepID=UPI000690250A|nr:copper amine oxidase N-terminal domain-containing protein [Paenibacillus wynnii]
MVLLKKILPACMALFLVTQTLVSAAPAPKPVIININGLFIATDINPHIQSGRVMIPVRTLASLGLTYSWNVLSHTATITNLAKDTFTMIQGKSIAYKNGQPVQMDSEANNYNGRMMVPARFVSEAFDYKVYYEKARGILFISSKDYSPSSKILEASTLKEARLAAISIPIMFSFKPDFGKEGDSSGGFYSYSFAANDASRYTYNDGYAITVVEINNGAANAVWQYYTVDIPGYGPTTLGGERPDKMEEMFHDFFNYSDGVFYRRTNGSTEIFKYTTQTYGDIIQFVPDSEE